jgi:hypothetical protein
VSDTLAWPGISNTTLTGTPRTCDMSAFVRSTELRALREFRPGIPVGRPQEDGE